MTASGFGNGVDHGALERMEIGLVRLGRHRADHAARHQEAERVDRVARVRAEHDVTRRRDRLRDVGEAFLGAQGGDHLGVGIELHAEAAAIVRRLRLAQAGNSAGGRIAVGARLADDLLELVDHMLRRRQVRIAHAEVDDVRTRIARRRLRAVDLLEHVRRQTADAVELFHVALVLVSVAVPSPRRGGLYHAFTPPGGEKS